MSGSFDGLSVEALGALADALRTGRLAAYDPVTVARHAPRDEAARVSAALEEARALGMTAPQIAHLLDQLHRERARRRAARDDIQLVWTGPEVGIAQSRDTQVVVRELFSGAEKSVLVATYRIYQWAEVFGPLADRMDARPDLAVRLYVHIDPPAPGASSDVAVADFADGFRSKWPGRRLPEAFYDPRTVQPAETRPSLHAKCVVVDSRRVLITSANFTRAAQRRNIEAGVALDDPALAAALCGQFENLRSTSALRPLPGLGAPPAP